MNWFNVPVTLSRYHNDQVKIKRGIRQHVTEISHAAAIAGTSTRTVTRWIEGSHKPPESVLRLFSVVFFGVMPWPEWQPFTMHYGLDNENRRRWLMCHDDIRQFWTPERLIMLAYGYDKAQELEKQRDTLQACVTALSTREAPPIPCAEIIPIEHYVKKSPV